MNDEQKDIIRQNYRALTQRLECSEELFSHFIEERIFTENMIDELLLKHGQGRSMKFLMDVQKKGPYAFDVLYNALVATYQYDLADILKPELAPSRRNTRQIEPECPGVGGDGGSRGRLGSSDGGSDPRFGGGGDPNAEETDCQPTVQSDDDSDLSDSLEYLDEDNTDLDLISLPVTPCSKQRIKKLFNTKSVYEMSSPVRGRCLVINNRYFEEPLWSQQPKLDDRDGSETDVKNITQVFTALGFKVITHSDLTIKDMLKVIQEETALDDHAKLGMFVLVIMTHGGENVLYGKHGCSISLSQVYNTMSPYEFKHMAGKPKIILVQACAGERRDSMGASDLLTADGLPRNKDAAPGDAVKERIPLPGESGNSLSADTQPPPEQSAASGDVNTEKPFPGEHLPSGDAIKERSIPVPLPGDENSLSADTKPPPKQSAVSGDVITEKPFPGEHLSTDDVFILRASLLGFAATRHPRQGSWFIRALVEALYKHACHRDIQAIFQQVKNKVRLKSKAVHRQLRHIGGQQPIDTVFPTEGRKLYLLPGYNP